MIKNRVRKLVKEWGTRNPFKLCEYLKIRIRYADLDDIQGYYKVFKKTKYIVLNENLDEFSMKIVLAHELGHAVLHKKEINLMKETFLIPKHSVYEREANKFAAELLLVDEDSYGEGFKTALGKEVFEELVRLKKENYK